MYSTRTVTVTVTYADILTDGGRRVSGSTCTVHMPPQLLYNYHDSYCFLHGYSDRGGRAVSGSTCTVLVPPQLL